MPKNYFKFVAAVYLILEKDGEVLLLRRANTGYEDGNYSLIAGHIEQDERAKLAMVREAKEEAGITVFEKDLKLVHVMMRNSSPDERFDFFFTTETWEGEIQNMEPEKCDDLTWHSLNKLPSNIIPCVQSALEHYKKGIIFSEFGWEE